MCQIDALIEETSYEDLQKLYLNHTSEKIPLLSDVLSYVNGRVPLLIELKLPTKSTRLCHEVHKLLETYQGAYLIQSFNTIGIFLVSKKCPAYSAWSAILEPDKDTKDRALACLFSCPFSPFKRYCKTRFYFL